MPDREATNKKPAALNEIAVIHREKLIELEHLLKALLCTQVFNGIELITDTHLCFSQSQLREDQRTINGA